jgi:hypothetical protein
LCPVPAEAISAQRFEVELAKLRYEAAQKCRQRRIIHLEHLNERTPEIDSKC